MERIDTTFDVYSDTPVGCDPDSYSPTLRRYHQALWSKPLPDGTTFELSVGEPRTYLHHRSHRGEFALSSDGIGATYRNVKKMRAFVDEIPEAEMDRFFALCSTIGAYLIFPSRRVNMKPTINGARGLNHAIRDRFDLTLECIRRYYHGGSSPLSETLSRYASFFSLFETFEQYVDFFLLQDGLNETGGVRFFIPFDSFEDAPLPDSVDAYREYKRGLSNFVSARNRTIEQAVSV